MRTAIAFVGQVSNLSQRNLGDEAPQRFRGLAQDRPGPNTKQFPIGADQRQLDRDGSDVDPQSMGHNRLAVPK